jgi:hypothetical protein
LKASGLPSGITTVNVNPKDFATFEEKGKGMKFDFVIGNPPYQHPVATSSKKLWPEFFEKSFDLCREGGYVALITPNSWQTPSSDLFEYFQKYQCRTVCLDAREYFPEQGSSITWYVIKKEERAEATETKVVGSDNKIDFRKLDFLPVDSNPLTLSIIGKLFSFASLNIDGDSYCHSQRQDRMSEIEDKDHPHPVKHGNSTVIYSKFPHPVQNNLKVVFHKSGKTISPSVDEGVFGASQDVLYKVVGTYSEGQNLCSYLTSNIISFLMSQTTYAMNMSKLVIKKIPAVDLSREWTNEELYKHFGLTEEEVVHVEKLTPKPKKRRDVKQV